jgi:hypothetical protein
MPIPALVWILLAAAGAGAVVLSRKRQKPAPLFTPQPLEFKPLLIGPKLEVSRYGARFQTGPSYVSLPPQIPADVLAAVASRLVYSGPFDNLLPKLNKWANGGRQNAEQHRGEIVSAMWSGIRVGVDGFGVGSANWEKQNHRWNAIAVAIQDALTGDYSAPQWWLDKQLLHAAPGYARLADLRPSAQVLTYRYSEVVYGIGCDLWDEVYVQGHTTRQIFARDYNVHAVGASPEQCRVVQEDRIGYVSDLLYRLGSEPGFTQRDYERELAAELLRVAKRKIITWPGGPASKPFVDWGYVIGALARMFGAAARGDVEEMADIAEEAGRKSREWSARPPGDEYGSADLAADLADYAGELAART